MVGVCAKYREALDEIARLKGLLSTARGGLETAAAAAEEARQEV